MRQLIIDTETTGLRPEDGHRITEIGCVELINRKSTGNEFQCYVNPGRPVDQAAYEITGLSDDFLSNKPVFAEVISSFISFLEGTDEIIIHNAPFDLGFLRMEFKRQNISFDETILKHTKVVDTLLLAREMFPRQKNSLDALCNRLEVKNFFRDKHGALLDSQILAEVYLKLTGKQFTLFAGEKQDNDIQENSILANFDKIKLSGTKVTQEDEKLHQEFLAFIEESNKLKALWNTLEDNEK